MMTIIQILPKPHDPEVLDPTKAYNKMSFADLKTDFPYVSSLVINARLESISIDHSCRREKR